MKFDAVPFLRDLYRWITSEAWSIILLLTTIATISGTLHNLMMVSSTQFHDTNPSTIQPMGKLLVFMEMVSSNMQLGNSMSARGMHL